MSDKTKSNIIRVNDFDTKNFIAQNVYTNPTNKARSVSIYANNPLNPNDNPSKFYLQTPYMYIPFELTDPSKFGKADKNGNKSQQETSTNASGDYKKYSLSFTFSGHNTVDENSGKLKNPKLNKFLENLKQFDDLILDMAVKNAEKWFPSIAFADDGTKEDPVYVKKLISSGYNRIVKPATKNDPKNPGKKIQTTEFAPTIRAKVSYRNNGFECQTYYDDKKDPEQTPIDKIQVKGMLSQAILRCDGIWLKNKEFGCTFSLIKLRIKSKVNQGISKEDYAFRPDDSDDENQVEENNNSNKKQKQTSKKSVDPVDSDGDDNHNQEEDDDENIMADEQDDEDEVHTPEPEPEPEPEPKPEPVKNTSGKGKGKKQPVEDDEDEVIEEQDDEQETPKTVKKSTTSSKGGVKGKKN
jgi:hypothetical protein